MREAKSGTQIRLDNQQKLRRYLWAVLSGEEAIPTFKQNGQVRPNKKSIAARIAEREGKFDRQSFNASNQVENDWVELTFDIMRARETDTATQPADGVSPDKMTELAENSAEGRDIDAGPVLDAEEEAADEEQDLSRNPPLLLRKYRRLQADHLALEQTSYQQAADLRELRRQLNQVLHERETLIACDRWWISSEGEEDADGLSQP